VSISYHVLGKPGRDNALYVKINSGKHFYRLLFDCGENVLLNIDQSEIKQLDYIFFSHCHIDHIAGFDYLFRRIYDREKSIVIYGPPGITQIIFNRLNGYTWNLGPGSSGNWVVKEIEDGTIKTSVIKSSESFSKINQLDILPTGKEILSNNDFEVKSFFLNHRIHSVGYMVKEKEIFNVDKEKLSQLGITAGEWLQRVKDDNSDRDEIIYTGGRSYSVLYLRDLLLRKREGDSIAYLTDFIFNDGLKVITETLYKCNTIVCESQYLDEDRHLAEQNFHLTSRQAGVIASRSGADKLILFHISERYRGDDFLTLLEDAREEFPNTFYPAEWNI
jgi:ribonuclease Z